MQVFRAQDQREALQAMTKNLRMYRRHWNGPLRHIMSTSGPSLSRNSPSIGMLAANIGKARTGLGGRWLVTQDLKIPTEAVLYEGLGLLLYRQSRLDEAAEAAGLSLSHYEAFGDDFGFCRVRNVLGIIDYDAGNVESARDRFLANLTEVDCRIRASGLRPWKIQVVLNWRSTERTGGPWSLSGKTQAGHRHRPSNNGRQRAGKLSGSVCLRR